MSSDSYERYVKGLEFLGATTYRHPRPLPKTREDWQLAERALESLHSATIGAGRNTYKEARNRYQRAAKVFAGIPRPPVLSLGHTMNTRPRGAAEVER